MWLWLITALEGVGLLVVLLALGATMIATLGLLPTTIIIGSVLLLEYGGYIACIIIPYYRSYLKSGDVVIPKWQVRLLEWYYCYFVPKWEERSLSSSEWTFDEEDLDEPKYHNLCYLGTTVWNILHWWIFEFTMGRMAHWLMRGTVNLVNWIASRWRWTRWVLLTLWLASVACWWSFWLIVAIGLAMVVLGAGWFLGFIMVLGYFVEQMEVGESSIARKMMWSAVAIWGVSCLLLDLLVIKVHPDPDALWMLVWFTAGVPLLLVALVLIWLVRDPVGTWIQDWLDGREEHQASSPAQNPVRTVVAKKPSAFQAFATYLAHRRLKICPIARKIVTAG